MTLTQEPQQRQEQKLEQRAFQMLDRVVALTQIERELLVRIPAKRDDLRNDCKELARVREERRRLLRQTNVRWQCYPPTPRVIRLAFLFLLFALAAHAGPLDYLLTNLPPKSAAAPVTYSATFAWDASTDAGVTNYTLFWGGKSGMYTNSVSTGTNRVRQVTGFAEGKYFAAVRAHARGTNSPFSNEVGFTLGPTNALRIITLSVESKDISVPNALWITIWSTQYNGTIGEEIYRAKAQ